jgi:murein DD-endopeptidase MepM/ murein hydrolase activator NlpD
MIKNPSVFLMVLSLFALPVTGHAQNAGIVQKPIVTPLLISVKESLPGKTFENLLESAGFTKHDANKLLIDPLIPIKMHLNPHEKFLVVTDPAMKRTEARFYLDYSDEALVFWRDLKHAGLLIRPIDFKIIKKSVEGRVQGSIIESIKKTISDEWAAFRFEDAFSFDFNLGKQLVKNDSYKFVIEEKYDEGKFVKYGEVLDAELKTHGQTLKRVLWENEKTKVFVDSASRYEDRPFYAPVDYLHISSPFSKRRFHPVRHNYQPHLGVDFALAAGSPIYAAKEGSVQEMAKRHGNGNYIMIHHDGDFVSTYSHLERWAPGLEVGSKVLAGQIIGYVGCTGYCTSPHLDFRIRRGNYLYDPMYLTKPYPYKERNYWETTKFKQLLGPLTSQN